MAWPLSTDYQEALQNPRGSFQDPELKQGQPVLNKLGLPVVMSGNFADVYQVRCPATGRDRAVKCFTREVLGLQDRYHEISAHLRQVKLDFTVDFTYLRDGIRIGRQWYPILKMQWVAGSTLNTFVRDHLGQPSTLEALSQLWVKLAQHLRTAKMAHADLQHGNVLLVPHGDQGALKLKLIDYDGMFVPKLAGRQSGEVGHPAYQHPLRLQRGTYTAEVDRFPHLVIACALRALSQDRGLWDRYDNGDNLLFRQPDFAEPQGSPLLRELWASRDALTRYLVGHLVLATQLPVGQEAWLPDLLGDGNPRTLTPAAEQQVQSILDCATSPPKPTPSRRVQIDSTPRSNHASRPSWLYPVTSVASRHTVPATAHVGRWTMFLGEFAGFIRNTNRDQLADFLPRFSLVVIACFTLGWLIGCGFFAVVAGGLGWAARHFAASGYGRAAKMTALAALLVLFVGLTVKLWSLIPVRSDLTNSIGMRFRLIPAGSFRMGSTDGDIDERPATNREVSRPFYLGLWEVTQSQYEQVMGVNPSFACNPKGPVENVSWDDAQAFCRRLSALPSERAAGHLYRLPWEAEWEYAARAGSSGKWCCDDDDSQLGQYAWYENNSGRKTHLVGQKKPNLWGLFDMHGNVWEWCQDGYDSDYYAMAPGIDPFSAPDNSAIRVYRGGSCFSSDWYCRSAKRYADYPAARYFNLGFRVALWQSSEGTR